MNATHTATPFWRRRRPPRNRDVTLLSPPFLDKSKRFETVADAIAESMRSEDVLKITNRAVLPQQYLCECRAGDYRCERTYCPICARDFRRWFTGETLRVVELYPKRSRVMTLLLAKSRNIHDLDPASYRHVLRTWLNKAGLHSVSVIGGFEIVYRAQDKSWVLHINLLFLGGTKLAISQFGDSFAFSEFLRPTQMVPVNESAKQLSYLLKFTTYHRPLRQTGSRRSPAKPLNAREHVTLVQWMSKFEFTDMMFLYGVRRKGHRLRPTAREK
jgi:hypothetical protein